MMAIITFVTARGTLRRLFSGFCIVRMKNSTSVCVASECTRLITAEHVNRAEVLHRRKMFDYNMVSRHTNCAAGQSNRTDHRKKLRRQADGYHGAIPLDRYCPCDRLAVRRRNVAMPLPNRRQELGAVSVSARC